MINVIICDDNSLFLNDLAQSIERVVDFEHRVFSFESASELLTNTEEAFKSNMSLLLTDIEMPDINGIELAKKLKEIYPLLQIIFITNYTEYVEKAFDVEPTHYIIKPINDEKLRLALNKAAEQLQKQTKNCLQINTKEKFIRIPYSEIKYIESVGRKAVVYDLNKNTAVPKKLDDLEKLLPDCFLRVHKSYLININMVEQIKNYKITLFNGDVVPVSKSKYPQTKSRIIDYFGNQL